MHHPLIVADDQQPRDEYQPHRAAAPVVLVSEKDDYDPKCAADDAEYRLVRSYSQQ